MLDLPKGGAVLPVLLLILAAGVVALLVYFLAAPLAGLGSSDAVLAAVLVYGALLAAGIAVLQKLGRNRGEERLDRLEKDLFDLAASVKALTGQIDSIREDAESAQARSDTLVSELKVLQTLLTQVVRQQAPPPRPISASIGPKVDPPDADSAAKGPTIDVERLDRIIRTALTENRVDLYLQPIVSLPSRKAVHYECFSRVRDEDGEIIAPEQFLPYVVERGLAGTLDNLLLFRCIQRGRRVGGRRPESRFFCNISSASLNDEEFFPQFIDYMRANAALADRLVFEFSHEDVQSMPDRIAEPLRVLAQKGFRFSLDQVLSKRLDGAALAHRGFGWLKVDVDRYGVTEGDIAPSDYAQSMARHEVSVIATRVEVEEQVLKLLDLNVAYAQGFLFGEPRLSREEPQVPAAGAEI
ncbi:MAG: EAL domain-containing protein [Rhodothalassiaceae bacterium]